MENGTRAFPTPMSKTEQAEKQTELSVFEQRRRMRRARMIVELTSELIRHDAKITHREARSLVDCARRAIHELSPTYHQRFNVRVAPGLERIIRERWPGEDACFVSSMELVN